MAGRLGQEHRIVGQDRWAQQRLGSPLADHPETTVLVAPTVMAPVSSIDAHDPPPADAGARSFHLNLSSGSTGGSGPLSPPARGLSPSGRRRFETGRVGDWRRTAAGRIQSSCRSLRH